MNSTEPPSLIYDAFLTKVPVLWNVKLKLELSVAMLSPSVALNVRANVPSVAPLSDDNGRIVKTDES